MQAIEYITRAMRECGATSVGEVPTGAEAAEGLIVLNGMIGQLQIQRLVSVVRERAVFDLVASQQSYTIGTGGNFNRFRPDDIEAASIIDTNPTGGPLEIPLKIMNWQEWQDVPIKTIATRLPGYLYYERSYPLGTISLYPVPSTDTVDVALYLPTPLTTFATLATDLVFPPGFDEMLAYNLAMRFVSRYRLPQDKQLERLAAESLGNVKRTNIEELLMTTDPELNVRGKAWNWLTGTS